MKLQVTVALTVGIIRALRLAVSTEVAYTEYMEQLMDHLLSEESLKKIHVAANQVECSSGTMPSYPEQSHDSIFLGVQLFKLIEVFLVAFTGKDVNPMSSRQNLWKGITETDLLIKSLPEPEVHVKAFASKVFKYATCTNWPMDETTNDEIHVLQSMTLVSGPWIFWLIFQKCSALCCLNFPDLVYEFMPNATSFLDDSELSPDLNTLITVIEALALVACQYVVTLFTHRLIT